MQPCITAQHHHCLSSPLVHRAPQVSDSEYFASLPVWAQRVQHAKEMVAAGNADEIACRHVAFRVAFAGMTHCCTSKTHREQGLAQPGGGADVMAQRTLMSGPLPCHTPHPNACLPANLPADLPACLSVFCLTSFLRVVEWDGAPLSARRLLSLCCPRGDDDMFSTYLELQELQVAGRLYAFKPNMKI
jgi:Protein of unknown function (DUF1749)